MSETPQHGSHAQGDDKLQKQASQLAYDVKYKVKQKLGKDSKLSPAQVSKAYMQQLAASPAPAGVKALAKKKLVGEDHTSYMKDAAKDLVLEALTKVFIEGVKEEEDIVVSESDEKTYKIKVTDKATGNTYVRNATRAKIAELRANKNISSVEMTGYGKPIDAEKNKGKQTAAAKAGKDYDGDGKVESPSKEHAGAVHNAIQRKKGGVPDGKDTRKEEVIYETEEKDGEKKITGKGVNNAKLIKIMPNLGEQIATEDPKQKQLNQQKLSNLKRLQMKKQQLERQKLNLQKQGKLPMGEEAKVCEKCGKSPCECNTGDERAKPTEMSLIKNKMRARGIQVASLDIAPRNMKTADELGEARNPEVEKKGKEVAGYEKAGKYQGITSKFRKEHPGSRQEPKEKGRKPTEGELTQARIKKSNQRVAKHGFTSKEKRESKAREKYDSARD
jgi:hypothetical protein